MQILSFLHVSSPMENHQRRCSIFALLLRMNVFREKIVELQNHNLMMKILYSASALFKCDISYIASTFPHIEAAQKLIIASLFLPHPAKHHGIGTT